MARKFFGMYKVKYKTIRGIRSLWKPGYDKFREAVEERNFHFFHSPAVSRCWIERRGKRVGALLKRKV